LPILNGESRDWRTSFLVEYYSDTVFPRMLTMGYSAVRTDRYKYIEYRELQNMNELYDLQADPYEERNLISTPAASSILERLRKELAGLKKKPAG
jgi:arylsulfatase A-like enzyme